MSGGEGGIRTPGTLSRTAVFKTAAIDHSATSPKQVESWWLRVESHLSPSGPPLVSVTQLSTLHSQLLEWQGVQDLNLQPTVLETATLPIELTPYTPSNDVVFFRRVGAGFFSNPAPKVPLYLMLQCR